tara:strand:+ start:935 stop:1207 length:273 start_codon:yes stop_codon:yes gene_type:complete
VQCLWGCLKRVHTIQSFKDDDKLGFKQIYIFEDYLTQNLTPVDFKLVFYNEDIHRVKMKKRGYYMISDCVQESQDCFKATQKSFIAEMNK